MTEWRNIKGTLLKPGVSANNVNYTEKHVQENDGKIVKIFVGDSHVSDVDTVVGMATLKANGASLDFEGRFRNTESYPDIVELTKDGLIDVSLDADPIGDKVVENGIDNYAGIDICGLHLVTMPGVKGATVTAVESKKHIICESVTKVIVDDKIEKAKVEDKDKDEKAKVKKKKTEGNTMEEADKLKAELTEAKAEIATLKESQKKELVESIYKLNPKIRESELMAKGIEELKVIESYEMKLKESEGEAEDEEKADEEESTEGASAEEGAGEGEVESEGPVTAESIELEEPVVNESKDTITLSESARKKFYQELRDSAPPVGK